MSVRVMSLVFSTALPPNEKILMLALADYASDDGSRIFPTQANMAAKTSMCDRTIRRLLQRLKTRGLIAEVEPATFHDPARYRMDLGELFKLRVDRVDTLSPPGWTNGAERVDNGAGRVDTRVRQSISTASVRSDPLERHGVEAVASWPSPDALVALYNEQKPSQCSAVKRLSEGRRRKARALLRQFPDRSFWETVMAEMRVSPLLQGRKNGEGHENWRADFDWLLQAKGGVENVVKVAEGRYRDAAPAEKPYGGKFG